MNEQTKVITQETPEKEEFIMLPTVDFCFKECLWRRKFIYMETDNLYREQKTGEYL